MRGKIRKILAIAGAVFLSLIVVLIVHIYVVTRPKAPDAHTLIMARFDIKQPLDSGDANKITAWLYQQPGVNHVLVNPSTRIAVFTFFPIKNSADKILSQLNTSTAYQGTRYIPTEEEMSKGCPAMSGSGYKLYSFVKKVFN